MRILIAEDEPETAQFVSDCLREHGHDVLIAPTGPDALRSGLTESLDLLILDRMLPGLDGLTVLRQLRAADVRAPAIMLTALGRIEQRIEGLDVGADDYLVKPFALGELLARVNALARRAATRDVVTHLVAGSIEMDMLRREVRRDGRPVVLQPREFRVLEELMRHPGEFVTRSMLLERVWDFHFDPQTKIVETHMSRLRSKLNEGGLPDVIETVRAVGYRIRI